MITVGFWRNSSLYYLPILPNHSLCIMRREAEVVKASTINCDSIIGVVWVCGHDNYKLGVARTAILEVD